MDEAGVRPDDLGEMGQEGDDVMLGDGFDLVDAGDVEGCGTALFPDRLCRRLRDDAEFGQRVAGMRLDLEPDAELGFGRPDGDHFRSGVARDHGSLLSFEEEYFWRPCSKDGRQSQRMRLASA